MNSNQTKSSSRKRGRLARLMALGLILCLGMGTPMMETTPGIHELEAKSSRKKRRKTTRYRVRRGDTLSKIARRFGLSVYRLARLNRMKPGSTLYAGKVLRVRPSKAAYRGLTARSPFFRKRKARRRGKKAPEYKESRSWARNGPTSVLIPYNYKLPRARSLKYKKKDYRVHMFARKFAQGHAVYVEILPHKGKAFTRHVNFKAVFNKKYIPLTRTNWGFKGLFPIAPYRKPGRYYLKTITNLSSKPDYFRMNVSRTRYGQHVRKIYLGNYDRKRRKRKRPPTAEEKKRWAEWRKRVRERRKMIRECAARDRIKKNQVFAVKSSNKLNSRLAHPRGLHKVTSKYYLKRIKAPYYRKGGKIRWKRRRAGRHRGLDLRARTGEPIYAMADGRVICAQHMYFEGKFVVIDHGNQVYTTYMHHSKLDVREGQTVRAGQLIGRSGETGYARGAHLHLALWIRGEHVHPLSLLSLPIRE